MRAGEGAVVVGDGASRGRRGRSRSWSRLEKQREKYRMSPSTWRTRSRSARTCLPPWVWKVCIAVRSFCSTPSRARGRGWRTAPSSRDVSVSGGARSGAWHPKFRRDETREARRVALAAGRRVTGIGFPVDVTRPGADIVPVVRARGVGVRRRKEACCLNSSGRRHPRWRSPEPPDLRDIFDP